MTEKLSHPDTQNPHKVRGAIVLAGTLLVAAAALPGKATEHYNFSPGMLHAEGVFARATPESCDDGGRAVGVELTNDPQTFYLGVPTDETHFQNAVRVEGTRQSLTLTPMNGLERTIFADLIPVDQVVQLPMKHDDMIVQIGRGPGAGNEERMMVVAGCSQAGVDQQLLFFEDRKIIHIPPMKESH